MSKSTVRHLLSGYRIRLGMVESAITRPKPEVVAGMRRLLAELESMAPDSRVRCEAQSQRYQFISADTGDLTAEIKFDETAEPP
jgi:hypothetical protein